MNRRVAFNHALAHAADLANRHNLPLLVYEGLTCTYTAANDRIHTFMLEAVPEVAASLHGLHAGYFFYLRARKGSPNDLLYRLAEHALCVVTDDYPAFIAAAHNHSVPGKIGVAYIAVDSSCIVPMSVHEKRAYGAYTIRPKIHRELPNYLKPVAPVRLKHKWNDALVPAALRNLRTEVTPSNIPALVASCEIDHSIQPSSPSRAEPRPPRSTSKSSSKPNSPATPANRASPRNMLPAISALTSISATFPLLR